MSQSRARPAPASLAAPENELAILRRLAEERAALRKERPTTVHLLAVLSGRPGEAQELLAARRLDEATLLKAGRTFDEKLSDPIGRALSTARTLARKVPASRLIHHTSPAGALQVLLALLSERQFAAFRALSQCGADIARLRAEAIELAHGRPTTQHDDTRLGQLVKLPAHSNLRIAGEPARGPRPAPSSASAVAVSEGPGREVRDPTLPPLRTLGARTAAVAEPGPAPALAAHDGSLAGDVRAPLVATSALASSSSVSASTAVAVPLAELDRSRSVSGKARGRRGAQADAPVDAAALGLDPTTQPLLCTLGRNLTLACASTSGEPVVGRDAEIERALDVLAKRHARNPLFVGPAGVGKSSLARGLAERFLRETPSPRLLIELSPAGLLAGTQGRGALAERLAALFEEARRAAGRVVLFIDDLDELVAGGADEVAGELKTALTAGAFALVGAVTPAAHRRTIESDAALCRRFSVIEVEEPDAVTACAMLRSAAGALEAHHGLAYPDVVLERAVEWSARYVTGRALPDKAIAILDLAGARARRAAERQPARTGVPARPSRERVRAVAEADVAAIVSETSGVPRERLLESDGERMLHLERDLGTRVIGHAPALERIARILRRNAAGLRGARPIGSFLLLGPTGVGKTETAKAIAEALFHGQDAMTRIDLSEYAEPHALARLIGAPPGYVGHEAGGALTEAVRRRPYQVVLLDEIEKAHRDVLETFLQVLDEGRLTDGRGRTVDFRNTVIVLTSNLGAGEMRAARHEKRLGFGAVRVADDADDSEATRERQRKIALEAARQALPPELYNRLDEVIVYRALERRDVVAIADKLLAELGRRLAERHVRLAIEPGVVDVLLASGGFDPELGARPMRRCIARLVEAPLAELILLGRLARGARARLCVEGDAIAVAVEPSAD